MRRNIGLPRVEESPATDDEARAAVLKFVRKIAVLRRKSDSTAALVFDEVNAIAVASHRLLPARKPVAGLTR